MSREQYSYLFQENPTKKYLEPPFEEDVLSMIENIPQFAFASLENAYIKIGLGDNLILAANEVVGNKFSAAEFRAFYAFHGLRFARIEDVGYVLQEPYNVTYSLVRNSTRRLQDTLDFAERIDTLREGLLLDIDGNPCIAIQIEEYFDNLGPSDQWKISLKHHPSAQKYYVLSSLGLSDIEIARKYNKMSGTTIRDSVAKLTKKIQVYSEVRFDIEAEALATIDMVGNYLLKRFPAQLANEIAELFESKYGEGASSLIRGEVLKLLDGDGVTISVLAHAPKKARYYYILKELGIRWEVMQRVADLEGPAGYLSTDFYTKHFLEDRDWIPLYACYRVAEEIEFVKTKKEEFGRLYGELGLERWIPNYIRKMGKYLDPKHVEELSHTVLLKALNAIEKGDYWVSNFKGWIFTIAQNVVLDEKRKASRVQFVGLWDERFVDREMPLVDDTLDFVLGIERSDLIEKALNRLPPAQAVVIRLAYNGYSTLEIRDILNDPEKRLSWGLTLRSSATEGSVKALKYRAMRALEEILNSPEFAELYEP